MTTPALTPTFRYDRFPQDLAEKMRETASCIRSRVQTVTKTIIEVGIELIVIKRQLNHGQFTHWVEIECGFSVRTAENYMRAAIFAAGKCEMVSLFRPATVYRLAAKGTPPEVVATVLDSIKAGHVPTDNEIEVLFKQARRRQATIDTRPMSDCHHVDDRALELATEILKRLGPELAQELMENWEAVGNGLHRVIETDARSAVDNTAPVTTKTETFAGIDTGDAGGDVCDVAHRVELVRDPNDRSLYRPKGNSDNAEDDGLGIPEFLDRSKNGIGAKASASPAP
jgi:DUF3102 family protein